MEHIDILEHVSLVASFGDRKFDHAIYFCVDQKFYPYALFVAAQISAKNKERDFDICIISEDDLQPHPLWDEHDLRIFKIETGQLSAQLPSDERVSFAAYFRIMAPALLKGEYSRLLYLDADVFYQRGDLATLFELDLSGRPIAAVRDMNQLRSRGRIPNDFRPFDLEYSSYFNSGIMLIDVTIWCERNLSNICINFAIENASKILQHDQTVLNINLQDQWAELPLVWNFMYSHQTIYFSAMFDVCFYHFVGRRKPFKGKYGGFPRRITREYKIFFDEYYPDLSKNVQDGLQIEKNKLKHWFVFLFHAINVKRFLVNDDYFKDDWDVK